MIQALLASLTFDGNAENHYYDDEDDQQQEGAIFHEPQGQEPTS